MTNIQRNAEHQEWLCGVTVLMVREQGLAYLDVLRSILDRYGFNVLCDLPIKEEQRQTLECWICDENQEREVWPCSGGLPAHFLVVHDVQPVPEISSSREAPRRIDNVRVLTITSKISNKANQGRSSQEKYSPVCLSRNATQTLECLKKLVPQQVDKIREATRRYNTEFLTPYPVLADLSKQVCRAKVELVDFHGTEAVCKTFRFRVRKNP